MKKTVFALSLLLFAISLHAKGIHDDINLAEEKARVSYAFGMAIGSEISSTGLELDYFAFTEGLKAMMENGEAEYSLDEAIEVVQNALQAAQTKQFEENRIKEELFLAANGGRPDVRVTGTGLQYEVLTEGNGARPSASGVVRVHYEGVLIDGSQFDSSYAREEPAEFPLTGVIPGWAEGLQLMSVGSKYKLYIPSKLAYGEYGAGAVIPPFSTLVFTVELLDIVEPDAGPDAEEILDE
jgi:FKBP-type peptidyl-prolyl cis-trans isomerase FkpA